MKRLQLHKFVSDGQRLVVRTAPEGDATVTHDVLADELDCMGSSVHRRDRILGWLWVESDGGWSYDVAYSVGADRERLAEVQLQTWLEASGGAHGLRRGQFIEQFFD